MTSKGFNGSKRLLACSQNFKMLEGEKVTVMLPKSWKKSSNIGTPVKMRRFDEFKGEILCIMCNNEVNEIKEFEENLNLLKRQSPNQFGHILPYCKE